MFPTQCVLLVGGRGSRLGALTDDRPKPMMPIAGRPFLDHLLTRLATYPFQHILLLAGYKGNQIKQAYHGKSLGSARIDVAIESAPLGTGGGLKDAAQELAEVFFLLNGDSLFDIDLSRLAARPLDGKHVARLALRQVAETGRAGTVDLVNTRITAFHERGDGGSGLINGGIYLMKRQIIDHIGATPCSLERDVFPGMATAGHLEGMILDGYFIDIGIPEDLECARQSGRFHTAC